MKKNYIFIDDTLYKFEEKDPFEDDIKKIVENIKRRRDFESSLKIMREKNLDLQEVVRRTFRLNKNDVVTLADMMLGLK